MQQTVPTHNKAIHQHIEGLLRHRIVIAVVLGLMCVTLVKIDSRVNAAMRQAYNQGFSWIGMYMHHEHPRHGVASIAIARFPTISSGNN
ncbi:MAG: hypothetical protein ACQR33_02810 [Candidatus Saccharibacteria bacterium]